MASAAAGAVAGAVVLMFGPWQVSLLAGWDVAALLLVVRILAAVLPLDATATAALATQQDNSRLAADTILLTASVASLVGVGLGLVKASQQDGVARVVTTAAAVATVVSGWAVVHVTYLLRYAHLHYAEGAGIDFNEQSGEAPDYRDFAYLAFTVGMTYQVSDTDLTTKAVRRTATHHALLSYLFGTVVVAMTINIVAGLINK